MSENDQQGEGLEPPEPRVKRPQVTYDDGPQTVEIEASTYDPGHTAWYTQGYRFEVDDTTARLITIDPGDDTAYDVPGTEATREAVAERVQDLPFIDRVILFDGVRRVGPALEYSDDDFEDVDE